MALRVHWFQQAGQVAAVQLPTAPVLPQPQGAVLSTQMTHGLVQGSQEQEGSQGVEELMTMSTASVDRGIPVLIVKLILRN